MAGVSAAPPPARRRERVRVRRRPAAASASAAAASAASAAAASSPLFTTRENGLDGPRPPACRAREDGREPLCSSAVRRAFSAAAFRARLMREFLRGGEAGLAALGADGARGRLQAGFDVAAALDVAFAVVVVVVVVALHHRRTIVVSV